ncbi:MULTISPECIES: CoA-acylating methylmalonate-semialdehyde dehydrogenase [Rhodococcus]|uniref:methylmalonate-semialdehyde dehydrogenase (CoA acylating) n=1 Tax=Rhodococcus oxybenzonivorans TaxID=1990687 RepID=A0AAE4V6L3_9NOCA|nr:MULTISPECIES: CoA-acylating methylmalonate-semialdehyde dehydrogenase [Rhodococcus]MDV7243279.1 CoA-acylating methylmalonate-semialdehyde dehydrogenase [Rhodococcus oxybenzonivorans]MDV7268758.1 CoA-acylating methylmalonate-semialdehyde dehydrogenase [Rhodococcus oxybenzonivorans]MDV7276707.1 CoA-acylating methylmalonate-semialdehyde dehydrogenase [Rhodococcus oxybenzonivorans]MDV7334462.1 CoA-acylating methylmalonate-semialdehyde dehydrogenase [Rhodococcus oxybenzonivorans]MDV7344616.1 CoA
MTTNDVHLATVPHWIAGAPSSLTNGRRSEVVDPATGHVLRLVELGGAAVVDAAVASARSAAGAWASTPAPVRATTLHRFRALMLEHSEELASIITSEQGKTLADARGEVARSVEAVEVAISVVQHLKGEYAEQVSRGVDTYSFRQPLGVCAGITPFNFPIMVPVSMFAAAIACGNSFVLKPSERVPSASVRLAQLLAEAELPDGVFNVVHGGVDTVNALIEHPDVAAISFVGSTPVAREIYRRSAAAGKKVQALGGANNHMVVMPDADLDAAADALASAAYGAAGQRCMAVPIAVAVGEIADELVAKTAERATAFRTGPGNVEGTDMGPLISEVAIERVRGALEAAPSQGANVVVDGRVNLTSEAGYFIGPSLVDNVSVDSDLYQKEVFGPILSVVRVDDLDEALRIVNASPYGNGATIFTASGVAGRRFAHSVQAGSVGINVPIPVPISWFGFGGWGDSRFGDDGLNYDAYRFYTKSKVVTQRWTEPRMGVSPHFVAARHQ